MYEIKNAYGNYVNAAVSSGAGKTKAGDRQESSAEQSVKVASCPEDMGNVVREG